MILQRAFRSFRWPVAAAALLALAPITQAQSRIGTVDLKKIFEGYYKTKQADAVLETNAREAQEIRDKMLEEHKKATEDYKKLIEGANDQAVSAEERDKRKRSAETKLGEIRDLERNIKQYMQEATTRIDEQKSRLREGIVEQIRKAIDEKAKAGNYAFVFDVSGESFNNRNPLVIYADGQNDLTTAVLATLNADAPPDLLTSGAAATPAKDDKKEKQDKPSGGVTPPSSAPAKKGEKK